MTDIHIRVEFRNRAKPKNSAVAYVTIPATPEFLKALGADELACRQMMGATAADTFIASMEISLKDVVLQAARDAVAEHKPIVFEKGK